MNQSGKIKFISIIIFLSLVIHFCFAFTYGHCYELPCCCKLENSQVICKNLNLPDQSKIFSIAIEQDGKPVEIKDHIAILKRKQFTIVLYFSKVDEIGLLVNSSFESKSFDSAANGKPISEIAGFAETGMAEYPFNKLKELMITNSAPHYWYYKNKDDHRFDEVKKKENQWVCKRLVSGFMDRDGTRKSFDIDTVDKNELYLVFIKAKWNKDFSKRIEKQRDYLKIIFK